MKVDAVTCGNIVYLKLAEEVARLFEEHHLSFVFLKGIALLETVYPDLSKRFMSDVDILVPPRDLKQAILLLQQLGFESPSRTLEFMKKGEMILRVDLHDRLWFFDAKKLWGSVRPKKAGSTLTVLSPEYHLLHVALHTILQDGCISQTALQDGIALFHYYAREWSWERFIALAREEGWSQTAAIYLRELAKMEPSLIPSADKVCHPEPKAKDLPFFGRDPSPSAQDDTPILRQELHSYSRMILAQEKFLKKVKLLWFILFPSLGFLKWRYPFIPSFLVWLLPFVRCIDLAWKGMLTYSHAETKR